MRRRYDLRFPLRGADYRETERRVASIAGQRRAKLQADLNTALSRGEVTVEWRHGYEGVRCGAFWISRRDYQAIRAVWGGRMGYGEAIRNVDEWEHVG